MTPYSQRDNRWKNVQLGFTKGSTIGRDGCTLTCLSMLTHIRPDEMNALLKKGKAFLGNLIVWTKLHQAVPSLRFVWRGWNYDNQIVKANLPCLVQVNAAKIGGWRHWVLFIGNHQELDPWDGKKKSTGFYVPLTGYSIVKRV